MNVFLQGCIFSSSSLCGRGPEVAESNYELRRWCCREEGHWRGGEKGAGQVSGGGLLPAKLQPEPTASSWECRINRDQITRRCSPVKRHCCKHLVDKFPNWTQEEKQPLLDAPPKMIVHSEVLPEEMNQTKADHQGDSKQNDEEWCRQPHTGAQRVTTERVSGMNFLYLY